MVGDCRVVVISFLPLPCRVLKLIAAIEKLREILPNEVLYQEAASRMVVLVTAHVQDQIIKDHVLLSLADMLIEIFDTHYPHWLLKESKPLSLDSVGYFEYDPEPKEQDAVAYAKTVLVFSVPLIVGLDSQSKLYLRENDQVVADEFVEELELPHPVGVPPQFLLRGIGQYT